MIDQPPLSTTALVREFGIKKLTAIRWKKRGVPLHDLAKLADWAAAQRKLPEGFLGRVIAMRDARQMPVPTKVEPLPAAQVSTPTVDPEWAEFEQTAQPEPDAKTSLASLRRAKEFASWKFSRASQTNDKPGQKFYSDLLVKFEGALHDGELRALRLGRDLGESFSADDVRRLGTAIGFWLMHGADGLITAMATKLTEAAAISPLDRAAVVRIIEPLILAERVAAPMQRAVAIKAGVALPAIFVESIKAGLALVVENDPPAPLASEIE